MIKRIKKKLALSLGILLSSFLLFGGASSKIANAETFRKDIVIEGNASGLVTIPDTDDFLVKDNFLPGDTAEGTIKLTNNYDYPYEVFLKADDIEKKSDEDFAKKLHLKIDEDSKDVYEGELQGEDKMAKEISLGVINPGETRVLNAKVTLDGITTTNEYKNKYASIQWIFTAERAVEEKAPAQVKKTSDFNKFIALGVFVAGIASSFVAISLVKRRGNCGRD